MNQNWIEGKSWFFWSHNFLVSLLLLETDKITFWHRTISLESTKLSKNKKDMTMPAASKMYHMFSEKVSSSWSEIKKSFVKMKLHFVIWHKKLCVSQLPACELISSLYNLPNDDSYVMFLKIRFFEKVSSSWSEMLGRLKKKMLEWSYTLWFDIINCA